MPDEPTELALGIDLGFEFCGLSYVGMASRKVIDPFTVVTPRRLRLIDRLQLVHQQLSLAIRRRGVVAVGYESPLRVGKVKQKERQTNFNPMVLSRIAGYIESLCWDAGIPVYELEVRDCKVAVVPGGTGSSTKNEVREAVLKLSGLNLDSHSADATGAAFGTARRFAIDRRLRLSNRTA